MLNIEQADHNLGLQLRDSLPILTVKALHHPEGSGVSVTAASQVRVSAMFLSLVVGNRQTVHCGGLQWDNVHADFSEKFIAARRPLEFPNDTQINNLRSLRICQWFPIPAGIREILKYVNFFLPQVASYIRMLILRSSKLVLYHPRCQNMPFYVFVLCCSFILIHFECRLVADCLNFSRGSPAFPHPTSLKCSLQFPIFAVFFCY